MFCIEQPLHNNIMNTKTHPYIHYVIHCTMLHYAAMLAVYATFTSVHFVIPHQFVLLLQENYDLAIFGAYDITV